MEGILCGSPEIQNALHPESGYIIIWPKLPDATLFHNLFVLLEHFESSLQYVQNAHNRPNKKIEGKEIFQQQKLRTSQGHDVVAAQSRAGPCMARAPQSPTSTTPQAKIEEVAMFTHSVRTRANSVKFSHQSLCNPKISSLMKALRKGYLKGCPNLSEELVTKY